MAPFENQDAFDDHMMTIALRAAERALGTTAPNPAVGALVADATTGEIVALAATAAGGRPHAEPVALAAAGPRARGATLYVTLEPCSHFGQTPPCAAAVIASGVARVVIAQEDPDPRVSGRGVRMLRDAGVSVERRRVLLKEARWVTRGHIVRVTERRPFIQVKMAVGPAGVIARGAGGAPVWVTGPTARQHGHLLRAKADAILIGAGTLREDDPSLTCRLPGLSARSPLRVVVAGGGLPTPAAGLVQTARSVPVWIFAGRETIAADPERAAALAEAGCRILPTDVIGGRVWLPAIAERLVAEGMTRVLVEGGPQMWQAFARAGLVDEVIVYCARAASRQQARSDVGAAAIATYLPGFDMRLQDVRDIGGDEMRVYRRE
ncbi:MAG: bifunctional diaminohydroxyphosphoribosylaminopyrimidine deaminase/5-amino-6-(5-phosphoribosylamino)uracil reductase RibD [Hyphomicrobiaceae bacterium]|nr:bifunctional diaminohydroxyphosphoribosylaminopyrimidine deaminase/5-amino-6-(5-phosphoribosylamino)uracil reductase RibD [Hyphomicrobiaceae bacterium]